MSPTLATASEVYLPKGPWGNSLHITASVGERESTDWAAVTAFSKEGLPLPRALTGQGTL